jgi:putative endonuclease
MTTWFLYIVRCRDGSLYTGVATDVRRRVAEHASERGKGAKYLRGRGPLRLVLVQSIGSRSQALRAERRIKKLPKARKERLLHCVPGGRPSPSKYVSQKRVTA